MALPQLTSDQREKALAKAAEARKVRAEFKKKVASGEMTPKQALHHALTHEILGKTRAFDFLRALPGIGSVKAQTHMQEMGIAESRRLSGLGNRQLEKLENLCVDVAERKHVAA